MYNLQTIEFAGQILQIKLELVKEGQIEYSGVYQ